MDIRGDTIGALPRAAAVSVPRAYVWLNGRLGRPSAVGWVVAIAFVASLPAIATGLVTDDYAIEASVVRDPWNAFVFQSRDAEIRRANILADREAGRVPWWIDESFQQAFLRPLASLSHAIDFRMWPNAVFFMHVENSLVFACVVWLASLVYRELKLSGAVLGLATFFYATRGSHATTIGWLAGRNTLLAAAFGLLALMLHLRASERPRVGRLKLQLMAAGALGCGLLCAEYAACAAGFLFAHALVFQEGPRWRRVASLWPYAIVLGAWQAVYVAGHYGAGGSGFYHGPTQEPVAFLLGVTTGLPIYLATQLTIPVATISCFYPWALPVFTALSVALLYGVRNLFLPLLRADRRARFLALGAALSTIPLGASVAQDRLVFFVGFGAAALLALVLTERFDPRNADQPRNGARRLFRIHAFYLPLLFVPWLFSTATANAVGGGADALVRALPRSGDRGVVLINAPSELLGTFQSLMRAKRGQPSLRSFDLLYAGAQSVEVRRTDPRSLELEVGGGYLAGALERIVRDPGRTPFHPGETLALSRMRVRVLQVNRGGSPTRVRFDFDDELERLPIDWLIWSGRSPYAWYPPPVGARTSLGAIRAAF